MSNEHISLKINRYFLENDWTLAYHPKGEVQARKTIQFDILNDGSFGGKRNVEIEMCSAGRWLQVIDGWGRPIADVDLREYASYGDLAAEKAVNDLLRKAYGG